MEITVRDFSTAIFGDIDLQSQRDWEEKVCKAAKLIPIVPLWQEQREKLAAEHTTYHVPEHLGGDTYYFARLELT